MRHRFGGDWTTQKLDVLAKYLAAYTTALSKKRFKLGYIDAFAGTGYREPTKQPDDGSDNWLFDELANDEPQKMLAGSAALALETTPRFDKYIFVERSAARCAALKSLGERYPDKADAIIVRQEDANVAIREIASKKWGQTHRAVLFLDPYGMQVEWSTIEAVAQTGAIDLWLLFPLGIGENRLAKRDGDIPPSWCRRLDLLLGTKDWYDEFYAVERSVDLFGNEVEHVVKATQETIGQYFVKRLTTVFPRVAPEPLVLRNRTGCPLYLLCFAAANPGRGGQIAVTIANHLLKRM